MGGGGGHFSGIVAMAVADKDVDEAEAPTESQTTGLVSGVEKARRPEGLLLTPAQRISRVNSVGPRIWLADASMRANMCASPATTLFQNSR